MPDPGTKARVPPVLEDVFNQPTTMYGCNKLYAEHLGRYYPRHYKQLSSEAGSGRVDFRSVPFPGPVPAGRPPAARRTSRRRTGARLPQSGDRAAPGMDRFRTDRATGVPNFFRGGDDTKQDYLASM